MNYLGQLSGERILITGASGFLGLMCAIAYKTVQKCMVFLEKSAPMIQVYVGGRQYGRH